MIEIIKELTEQQRSVAWQHQGVVKAYRLAQRYQQLVREITQSSRPTPLPLLIPVENAKRTLR